MDFRDSNFALLSPSALILSDFHQNSIKFDFIRGERAIKMRSWWIIDGDCIMCAELWANRWGIEGLVIACLSLVIDKSRRETLYQLTSKNKFRKNRWRDSKFLKFPMEQSLFVNLNVDWVEMGRTDEVLISAIFEIRVDIVSRIWENGDGRRRSAMRNDFKIIGDSSCACPKSNFNFD
jgi:hypothetical protein